MYGVLRLVKTSAIYLPNYSEKAVILFIFPNCSALAAMKSKVYAIRLFAGLLERSCWVGQKACRIPRWILSVAWLTLDGASVG